MTFLAPIKGMVLLVIMAISIDTIFGIYYAIKNKDYQSDKLFNVVVKTFFYSFSILFAFIVSKEIFEGQLFGIKYLSVKLVTAFWIYIEMKSKHIKHYRTQLPHKTRMRSSHKTPHKAFA